MYVPPAGNHAIGSCACKCPGHTLRALAGDHAAIPGPAGAQDDECGMASQIRQLEYVERPVIKLDPGNAATILGAEGMSTDMNHSGSLERRFKCGRTHLTVGQPFPLIYRSGDSRFFL